MILLFWGMLYPFKLAYLILETYIISRVLDKPSYPVLDFDFIIVNSSCGEPFQPKYINTLYKGAEFGYQKMECL